MELAVTLYVIGYLMALGCHVGNGDFRAAGTFSRSRFAVLVLLGLVIWPVTLGTAIVAMGKRDDGRYKDEPWPLDD